MILAEMTTGEGFTTLGGVAAGVLGLMLKDIIRDRASKPREQSKVDNLAEQTEYLRQIASTQEKSRRFGKKQAKRIRQKLDGIHADVLAVKQQTKKDQKP